MKTLKTRKKMKALKAREKGTQTREHLWHVEHEVTRGT